LRAATEEGARFMTGGEAFGVLEPGRSADFIVLDGSPLADIALLQDKARIRAVFIAGKEIRIPERRYDPNKVTDFALSNWTELYTRERVAALSLRGARRAAAE
jgi:cytosine/adenosine deaminase-related metal-dependent hydrolase